jgi:hypothetical protein
MYAIRNTFRNYTPEEALQILREEHRICNLIDCEADKDLDINMDMKIIDWRIGMNFFPWKELYHYRNIIFNMNLSLSIWMEAVRPEREKTVSDMCIFISQHAKKEIIQPVRIFGRECMGAAVFLTLKKNLPQRGVYVDSVKPSTPINSYLENNFPNMIMEIIKTGVKTFEVLKPKLRDGLSFCQRINFLNPNRLCLDTGSIKTFGDLSRKIVKGLSEKTA